MVTGPIAVTAHQTIHKAREQRKESVLGKKPPQLNSCHAYGQNSNIVKRMWPEFYKTN